MSLSCYPLVICYIVVEFRQYSDACNTVLTPPHLHTIYIGDNIDSNNGIALPYGDLQHMNNDIKSTMSEVNYIYLQNINIKQ